MSAVRAMAAVTGIGVHCAAGQFLDDVLDRLDAGGGSPAAPSRLEGVAGEHPVFEAPVPVFPGLGDPLFHEPGLAFLLASARQALAGSGRDPESTPGLRMGVCVGSSVGFSVNYFPAYKAWRQDMAAPAGFLETFRRSNYALALRERLNLTGPCQLVSNACASGTDAIGVGASWIASGLCDAVLAGGAEALSFISYLGFIRLMITDSGPCRPFDRARNGLNLGEGAAVLLLERPGSGRRELGHVLGYGLACDAYHPTAPHPEGRGLKSAFASALGQAGVTPGGVAFVNAHGTGTRDNDKVESAVLREMLPGVPVLATKGATGHALGAAGAVEAAITLGCLNRGRIPASPGFREPDPELGLTPTAVSTVVTGRVAVSSSLAFGGSNSVLVLGGAGV